MPLILNIHQQSPHWRSCHDVEKVLDKAVQTAWKKTGQDRQSQDNAQGRHEIGLVLADNVFIQNLNKTYRDKDQPTNVLSFPNQEAIMPEDDLELGDVIFGFETIAQESQDAKISLEDHLSHMVIHGLLHLLGYDHIEHEEAEEMEKLETVILAQLGIIDPYG